MPDAALFLGAYGKNLPETYTFLPDADILVVSSVGGCYISAAFGKNMERVHTELPDAAIFALFCRMRHFFPDPTDTIHYMVRVCPH